MELFYMNDEWLVRVWDRARGSERRFARALGRAWDEDVPSGAADVIVVGPEGGEYELRNACRRPFSRREMVCIARAQRRANKRVSLSGPCV